LPFLARSNVGSTRRHRPCNSGYPVAPPSSQELEDRPMEVPSVGQNCSGLAIAAGPRFCPTATGDNRTGVGYTTRKARAHVASFVRRGCDGHSKSSSTNFTYIGVFHAGDRLADLSRLLPAGGRWCDRVTRQDISRGRGTPQWGWPARRGRRGRGARWIEHDLLRPEVGERASSRSTNGVPPPTPPGGQNSSLRFVDSMRNSPGSPRRTRAVATCQRSCALKEPRRSASVASAS